MPNNIAVSITADVAGLQVGLAQAKASSRDFQSTLNDLVKTANSSGWTDELRTKALGAGDSLAKARNEAAMLQRQLATTGGGTGLARVSQEAKAATGAMEGLHSGSAGVTRELMVMLREAARGNFSRLAGSATILAGRMGILETILNPVTLVLGAVAAGLAYMAIQEYEAQRAATQMSEAFALSGRSAGESAENIRAHVQMLSQLPGVSRAAAEASIRFDSANAQVDARLAEAANQLLPQYIKAFGKDGPDALGKMKTALAGLERGSTDEIVKKFQDLNATLLNLPPNEAAMVEGFIRSRDVIGAVNRILGDLAAEGGGHIQSVTQEIKNTQDELRHAQADLAALKAASDIAFGAEGAMGYANAVAHAEGKVSSLAAELQRLNAVAATSDKGEDINSAVENSHATMLSLRDSASRAKDAVAQLKAEMKQRIDSNPNDQEAKDYFQHEGKYDHDLQRKEDPADFKKPKAPAGDKDRMSAWRDALQDQLNAQQNWFAEVDQATATFWDNILKTEKLKTAERLQVQREYQQAVKGLGVKAYEDKLAGDKTNITKAGDDPTAKAKAWDQYFRDLSVHYAQDAKQYQDALAEKARDDDEALKRRQADATKKIERSTATTVHDDDAGGKATDIGLEAQADRVKAAAEMHVITARQEAAQLAAIDRETAENDKATTEKVLADTISGLNAELAANVGNAEKIEEVQQQITAAKQQARDREVEIAQAAARKELDAQLHAAEQASQTWHSRIDPMVSATGNQIKGLLTGTETWGQAIRNIGEEGLNVVIQAIERMAEQWIVAMITGQAAQAVTATTQVAAYSAVAGAAGVASMAGAPFPLDMSAPAFGASMSKAATAFGSVGGFAKGLDVVPNDMIAQIHEGERIMPAADNRQLMSVLAGLNSKPGGSRSGSRGPAMSEKRLKDIHEELQRQSGASSRLQSTINRAARKAGL